MAQTPLVIGNWKANPMTIDKAKELLTDVKKHTRKVTTVDVVVTPPFVYMETAQKALKKSPVALGAQNMCSEMGGAHTGEVSLSMLQSLDATHVIIGHSERRAMGETDKEVATKVALALKHKFTTVVCVGEEKRDRNGAYFTHVKKQVLTVLRAAKPAQLKNLVIAYEPIWAIGTGKTATAQDAYEMKIFIQKIISDEVSRAAVKKVRVLYGGSVKKHNAAELFADGEVDGFLVGGASLQGEDFGEIVKAVA